jgi:type IV secretory pathway VirB6-like protein
MLERLSAIFQNALLTINDSVYQIFANTVTPFVVPIINLYIIIIGIRFMIGEEDVSKKNLVRLFLIFPAAMLIIGNYDLYKEFVMNPIFTIKDYLVEKLFSLGKLDSTNDMNAIETILLSIIDELKDSFEFSITDWNLFDMLLSLFVLIFIGLLYLLLSSFHIISFVIPSLILIAGPIPIALYAFNKTKHITEAWFKTAITYYLYGPISALFLIFIFFVSKVAIATLSSSAAGMIFLILASYILVKLTNMIPELANGFMTSLASDGGLGGNSSFALQSASQTGAKASIGYLTNKFRKGK